MPYFVIVSKSNCAQFAQVCYLARFLNEHLPNFHVKLVQKKHFQWERWLEKKMNLYKWNITVSPIIYRQLIYRGGIPHLIGSISEFWQYCYDYYNIECLLPESEILNLIEDNQRYFPNLENEESRSTEICIFGIYSPILVLLLLELENMKGVYLNNNTKIKLFDISMDYEAVYENVKEIANDLNNDLGTKIEIVENLQDALEHSQLVIIIDDLYQKSGEALHQWRLRNVVYMHILVDYINKYAQKNLRVILGHYGPVCFNATLLTEACTSINPHNIVAVTSDLGLAAISVMSKKANIPIEKLGAPTVWGYIGINEFIEVGSIIKKCDIYRPNTRAITTNGGSTLPLGTIKTELRFISYITDYYDDIEIERSRIRETVQIFNRPPAYSKVRAIASLIQLWYDKKPNDAIISLGVCSNGTFNIKSDVVFSQPVILKNGTWVPYSKFPLTEVTKLEVKKLSDEAEEFMNTYLAKKLPTEKEYVYV